MYSDPTLIDDMRLWLDYEPSTGLFRWKKSPRYGIAVGTLAGNRHVRGYWHLSVLGRRVLAHRLAWAFTHGEWPTHGVDHINGIKSDNRISNLRDVPQRTNMQNQRRAQTNSSTGLLGVSPLKGKFAAHIVVDGEKVYLGRYDSPGEAHGVYLEAKRRLHAGCSI